MRTRRSGVNTALGVAAVFAAAGWLYAETYNYARQRGVVMHDIHCPEHGFAPLGKQQNSA